MNGHIYLIPPAGDMTATEYEDSSPSLTVLQELVGSSYLDIGLGLSTFEEDGKIVPSAAAANAKGEELGLDINGAATRLLHMAQMRAGKASAGDEPARTLRGNVVIGTGDQEFLTALRALFPQPTAP